MNYFFAKVANRLKILKKINVLIDGNLNKKKVAIPIINGLGFANMTIIELWMCSLLEKIIPLKKGSFVDIGVNIGQTLMKLRSVDSNIDYVGFEPNPLCVYYTGELIKANQFKNTRLVPVGIFNTDGVLQLNMYSEVDTDPAASMIENFRPGEKVFQKIYVPVSRFETANGFLHLNELSIVKIDVEGAELEVLESLEHVLNDLRPFIFIEILPCYTESNAARIRRQKSLESLLQRINYCIFRVLKQDQNTVTSLQPLAEIGIHGDLELCDYVMAPVELSGMLESLFISK